MSLEKNISFIINDFEFFDNWEEKYEHLIDLGNNISELDQSERIEKNLIKGCQAQVWLICKIENRKLILRGDSDAIITKGLVGLLITVYNGVSPEEVVNSDPSFLEKTGLSKHLSMTRSNGINEMRKKIISFCKNYLKNE